MVERDRTGELAGGRQCLYPVGQLLGEFTRSHPMTWRKGITLVSLGVLFAAPTPGYAEGLPPDHPAPNGRNEPTPVDPRPPNTTPLSTGGAFSPSLFNFVTALPDRGTGKGGGWQVATAKLNFVDTRYLVPQYWSCLVEVGMPLRTEHHGKISPADAAQIAADVATEAATLVIQLQTEWMPVAFCKKYGDEMRRLFRERYKSVGARVEKSQ
jgi:hypothetical protein